MIVCTHGFVKKTAKLPKKQLKRAKNLRIKYFEMKRDRDENL